MGTSSSIWKKYKIVSQPLVVGSKTIQITKHNSGFRFCVIDNTIESKDENWRTFVVPEQTSIEVMPALPDKAIVIKPVDDYNILAKESVSFFIPIPINIQINIKQHNQNTTLVDEPLNRLSLTWFGAPDGEGEIAYSIKDKVDTKYSDALHNPEFVICPVKIYNNSNTVLNFNRVILRVQHLNIYAVEDVLFTNEVHVHFSGVEQNSHIRYVNSAPVYMQGLKKIVNARVPSDTSILKRSFDYIKAISQYQN